MKKKKSQKPNAAKRGAALRDLTRGAAAVNREVPRVAREVACALWHWRMLAVHLMLQPLPVQLGLLSVVLGIVNGVVS